LKLGKERKIPTPVNAYLVRAIKKAEKETG